MNQISKLRLALFSAVFTCGFGAFSSLQAATPIGGLTVAVSKDGKKLVAGGDTRTLLVLDPATLEVRERHWIAVSITDLAFSEDGASLVVQDTEGSIILFNAETWEKKAEKPKRDYMAVCPAADLLAGYDNSAVHLHKISDLSEHGAAITMPKDQRVAALAFNLDGARLAILSQRIQDEEEPNNSKIPENLKGLARDEFRQKNDGSISMLTLYEIPSGTKLGEHKLYYTTNLGALFFQGDDLVVLVYNNQNARISASGEVTMFALPSGYNYGIGLSWDSSHILVGGLASFSVNPVDSLPGPTGAADKLPSWPEYWKGFDATPGATRIYGGTTAYRVFQLDAAGKVVKAEPVK